MVCTLDNPFLREVGISAGLVFVQFDIIIGFVHKICEALPCGTDERMHYLLKSELGLIVTPLLQDLFLCVCAYVCASH